MQPAWHPWKPGQAEKQHSRLTWSYLNPSGVTRMRMNKQKSRWDASRFSMTTCAGNKGPRLGGMQQPTLEGAISSQLETGCGTSQLEGERSQRRSLSIYFSAQANAIKMIVTWNILHSSYSLFNTLNKYLTSLCIINTLVLVFRSLKPSWFYPPSLCWRCCSSSWQTWLQQQRWSRCGAPHTPLTDHSSPTKQNSMLTLVISHLLI